MTAAHNWKDSCVDQTRREPERDWTVVAMGERGVALSAGGGVSDEREVWEGEDAGMD